MPRTKFDAPKGPPIDLLKAVILERKVALDLNCEQMATGAGVSNRKMGEMLNTIHTDDWDPKARRKLCRFLGLCIETTIKLRTEDGGVRIA